MRAELPQPLCGEPNPDSGQTCILPPGHVGRPCVCRRREGVDYPSELRMGLREADQRFVHWSTSIEEDRKSRDYEKLVGGAGWQGERSR